MPTASGQWLPNVLPGVARWKILDNLRRSLVPPALVVLLILGWIVLPGSPWFWTALALAVLALPLLLLLTGSLVNLARYGSWRLQWQSLRETLGDTAGQALLNVFFLADQARSLVDAVVRDSRASQSIATDRSSKVGDPFRETLLIGTVAEIGKRNYDDRQARREDSLRD